MKAAKLRAQQQQQETLYTIRVGKIPPKVSDDSIREVFSYYGEIRHFSRPILKDKCIPSQFAFIKYRDEASAKEAAESMNNAYIWDVDLTVDEANAQESFFSGSTGGLVNHEYNFPPREIHEFDSSMPYNHYQIKRQEALLRTDDVYPIKVEDLHPDITKEMLMDVFSNFGDIASIYQPVDLKHGCRPLGIAFVRYTSPHSAQRAVEQMNGVNLGIGRDIIVTASKSKSYFNQDETFTCPKKWISKRPQEPVSFTL